MEIVGVLYFGLCVSASMALLVNSWQILQRAARSVHRDFAAEYSLRQCGDLAAYRENFRKAWNNSRADQKPIWDMSIAVVEGRLEDAPAWNDGSCALSSTFPLAVGLRRERRVAEDLPNVVAVWQWSPR